MFSKISGIIEATLIIGWVTQSLSYEATDLAHHGVVMCACFDMKAEVSPLWLRSDHSLRLTTAVNRHSRLHIFY